MWNVDVDAPKIIVSSSDLLQFIRDLLCKTATLKKTKNCFSRPIIT